MAMPTEMRHDARLVLVQKEQEIADVRRRALEQLEEQITAKDECIYDLSAKLGELKQDFEFNINLLEERDAELEKYDVELAALKSLLQQKDQLVLGLQAAHAQLEAEMRHLRATSAEAESSLSARVEELQLQLQDVRFQSNEHILRQQEHYEAQKRALQRALAEAEEEIERQRRDMAAAFTMQMQGLEVRYKQAAEEACMEGELSRQRAAAAEQEAREAREREVLKSKAAEDAEAAAASREREARALRWELDSSRKLLEARLAEATTQLQAAQHQHQMVVGGMADHIADLEGRLAAAQKVVEELKEQGAHSASRREQQQREEVAALQLRLEQVFGRGRELEARVGELQSALKVAGRTHLEQLEGLRSEAAAAVQAAQVALADAQRQHEAQLRDAREQLWVKEEEGRALRGRAEGLQAALEQRRCDLEAYKEQLVAAGERERQLQRQLVAAEMKLEACTDVEDAAAAGQLDAAARRLTEQRDTANAALQDALSRLAAKEAELQSLRTRLHATTTTPSASVAAPPLFHRPHHAAPARPPTSGPPSSRAAGSPQAEALHHAMGGHRMDASAAGGPHAAGSAGQPRGRPPPLSLSQSIQDLRESLADLTSLPSPHLPDLPPSPGSNASYWLGPAPTTSPRSPPGMSPRSPPGSPHRTSPLDRSLAAHRHSQLGSATGTQQQQQQQQQHEVAAMWAALQEERAQKERLLGATAMMRGELEALHARQQELERQAGEVPADVGVLQAEVVASDRDLQHAYDHLAAVQQRLAGGQGGGEEQEVAYLRLRVGGLMAENRTLRRWVASAQLDALASTAHLPPGPAQHAATPAALPPPQQEHDEQAAATPPSPLQLPAEGSCGSSAQEALHGGSIGALEGAAAAAGAGPGSGPGGGGCGAAAGEVTAAAAAAAEEAVGELEGQLEEVQEEVAALRQENTQLMEMSSLLRAERDHLLQQLSAASPISPTPPQLSADGGPRPSSTPSRGPWSAPTFLLPLLNPYLLPAVHSPPRRPSTSPPTASSSQQAPSPAALPPPAHPRQASAAAAAIRDVLHAAAAGRRGGSGVDLPQGATGAGRSATSSSAAAGPQGVVARPESGEAGGMLRAGSTNPPQEASPAHGEGRLPDARPAPDQPLRSTTPTRRLAASGSAPKPYVPTTVSLNPSGPLGLATSGPPARPSPPSKVSQRETPSQRATLRALQQRREQAARPKVRNYNLKE